MITFALTLAFALCAFMGPDAKPIAERAVDDGLSCGGNLVLIGDSALQVVDKCGQPVYASRSWDRSGHKLDLWVYQERGSFPRYVRLRDDFVVAIEAGRARR